MRDRSLYGLMLVLLLLLTVAGSSHAHGLASRRSIATTGVNNDTAAQAPWFNSEIDTPGNTGQHVSVAMDESRGWTYISYYDATNQALRMARNGGPAPACDPNNDWGCLTIDSGADIGKYSSIAINPVTGGIGFAYHDATNGKLKYAYLKNPHLLVHSIFTIDVGIFPVSSTGLHTSLKYNSNGTPFIAYYFENSGGADALMLAYYSVASGNCPEGGGGDEWRCETIITGEGVGKYASLDLTDDWEFHIAYYDEGNGDLWYATSVGEGNCGHYGTDWVCYPVSGSSADVGQYASMYMDDSGSFHIAYYNATANSLMYAADVGSGGNCGILGSAQCDEIDAMPAGYHPMGISIAEDAAGYPVIAYQAANGSLNVARPVDALGLTAGAGNCGPENPFSTWYCETIDHAGTWITYRNGDYASIITNSSGLATIAYQGFITASGGNLMVSQQRLQGFLPLVIEHQ